MCGFVWGVLLLLSVWHCVMPVDVDCGCLVLIVVGCWLLVCVVVGC